MGFPGAPSQLAATPSRPGSSSSCTRHVQRRETDTGLKHTFKIPFIKGPWFLNQVSERPGSQCTARILAPEAEDTAAKPGDRECQLGMHTRPRATHSPTQSPSSDSSLKESRGTEPAQRRLNGLDSDPAAPPLGLSAWTGHLCTHFLICENEEMGKTWNSQACHEN